jgi:hypothetical protein
MKAILLAAAVVAAVFGLFAYIIHRDPNRAETTAALAVLHQIAAEVPIDPAVPGYLNLKGEDLAEYSVAMALPQLGIAGPDIVKGTLLKQEYQLRQAEYQLAQIRRIGGDVTSTYLENKRSAYVTATVILQAFLDSKSKSR